MDPEKERRQHVREALTYDCLMDFEGKSLSGKTRDVSPYGAGVFSAAVLEPGTRVNLSIFIPQAKINIETKGEVAHCREVSPCPDPSRPYLAGIRFTEGPLESFSPAGTATSRHTPSHTLTINSGAARCYELIGEFQRYPDWASGIKSTRVLDAYPDGRGRRVEFEHDFFLRRIHYTLDYSYDDTNRVLSWVSSGGDREIVTITGSYSFAENKPSVTFATYKLDVTLSIVPSERLVKFVTSVLMRKEMKNFQQFVEKNG